MKNKLSQKVTAILTFVFILSFLFLTLFREKGVRSYQENRDLAKMPKLTLSSVSDGSYFSNIGVYFNDHFAGRSHWISFKGAIEAEAGDSIVNDVYITDSMLLDISEKDYPSDEEAMIINNFAESYGGAVYFTAVPSSVGVYSDLIPAYLNRNAEKEAIDSLYSKLDLSVRKIDAYNILKMLNDNYIYYRSDSKWTGYGAYCVYRTVIQKLGFLPTTYDKYTIEHISGDFRGNLYNKSQYTKIKADMLDIYTYSDGEKVISCTGFNSSGQSFNKGLYDRSYINSNDMYRLYLGDSIPLVKIKTSVNNEKKLLVIKNDYANCFIPFLIQHYSEIAVVSPEYLESGMSSIIDKDEYAQTLFLFGLDDFPESDVLNVINQ